MFSLATPLLFSHDLIPPSPKIDNVKVVNSEVFKFGKVISGYQITVIHSAIGIKKN